jgi:hypothetical protein
MMRGQFWSSSWSLSNSSSHQRFRVFFAGGGAVGEGVLARGGGDAGRCSRDDSAVMNGSVWMPVELVARLLR